MDLRLYDQFIIDCALKDEKFKNSYIEMLYKLTYKETSKYNNFEEFESENEDYLIDGASSDRTTFKYDIDGIDLKIGKGEELYSFYTFNVDLNKLCNDDISKPSCGEICAMFTKENCETRTKLIDYVIRVAKIDDEYKLIVDEGDPYVYAKTDRRVYGLNKVQVEDIIAYVEKVKNNNLGF